MRVLDFTLLLPGPYCSCILADYGAEVIKIERPGGGDWVRYVPPLDPESGESLLFRTLNRNKKSLTLNLKSDEGRRILFRLVETADVLLESFRTGVMERLGLGYEALARVNPRLVYCSLSGYGPDGPYRERAGHDLNYVGLAGLLDLTGPREGPPAIPGAPVADLTGALWATIGILLALLERELPFGTGQGQRVDVSLLGGALACLPLAVTRHLGGQPMERGASELTGGQVCYNVYPTRDGGYMTLSALEPEFWTAFCRAVGREDLQGQQFAPAVPGEPAYEELCALFRTRTRQEWMALLAAESRSCSGAESRSRSGGGDACCEPVYSLGEALASAPVQALGMVAEGGLLPPVRLHRAGQPTPTEPLAESRSRSGMGPAPGLGQHTAALLAELGYDEAEIKKMQDQGVI